ncbi:hypothetical protein [Henriciella litoralis]|uniref:hypothetical protein n=1 Tax=Henriciella litoralis TaxID=568102 RepID=UPI000A05F665|nr:hypothetical protein [Henriciella litoralis]
MANRISKKMVTFEFPFQLDELDEELPAGGYTIETEDQAIDGMNFIAHRCIETVMVIRPPKGSHKAIRYVDIDPAGLEAALARDAAQAEALRSAVKA